MRRVKDILLGAGLFLVAVAYTIHLGVREMDSDTKKVCKLLLIVGLLIAVARLMEGQRIVYRDSLVVNGQPIMGEAYVDCDSLGLPTIYTTKAMTVTVWWPELLVHEETHLSQMAASGLSCAEYMLRFKADPQLRLQIESEAYCAGVLSVYRDDWKGQISGVVENLYNGYSLNLPRDSIERAFTNICEVYHARQRPFQTPTPPDGSVYLQRKPP